MDFGRLRELAITKGPILKPDAKAPFKIKGWGRRRGEDALIYTIPNHKNPERPYQKGINLSEWENAYNRLIKNGEFSRSWFNSEMASCAAEGPCNFTTIGGIFEMLGYATYRRGSYLKKV